MVRAIVIILALFVAGRQSIPAQGKAFSPKMTSLDSFLVKERIPIDTIYPAGEKPEPKEKSKGKAQTLYSIQLATVADFETAERRRGEYTRHLGSAVDIVFDPPFYKLRFGQFASQKQASNKMEDLQELGVSGFIVKVP